MVGVRSKGDCSLLTKWELAMVGNISGDECGMNPFFNHREPFFEVALCVLKYGSIGILKDF